MAGSSARVSGGHERGGGEAARLRAGCIVGVRCHAKKLVRLRQNLGAALRRDVGGAQASGQYHASHR
eukprot:877956-Prymnesium_polylepis.1